MPGYPNDQGNPDGAIPVYLTAATSVVFLNYSVDLVGGEAQPVMSINPSRKYLFIQCVTPGLDVWVNMLGDTAAPNTAGSFLIAAGQTYESANYVPPAAVSIYADTPGTATIIEGAG